jgi:pentapeptide MXKDX repeat protein
MIRVAHGLVINTLSWCVTSDGLFRSSGERHPSPHWKMPPGDICSMIKRLAIILSAATLSFGLALPPAAFADEIKKDTMSNDAMSKDSMKRDAMSKDSMSKDAMSKDAMSKDSMSKDGMKKDDTKKN